MKHKYQKKLPLAAGLFSVALSGCASWYTPGMSELQRLCELDGGDRIYQTVQVDGYFKDFGRCTSVCVEQLMRSEYQYIEFHEGALNHLSLVSETGYWRIYKSHRGDPDCSSVLEKEFEDFVNPFFKAFFSKQCLVAKKLNKPESRYWYRSSSSSRFLDEDQAVKLIEQETSVEDYSSGELLAKRQGYLLYPYKKSALSYGFNIGCAKVGVSHEPFTLNELVLIPSKLKGN